MRRIQEYKTGRDPAHRHRYCQDRRGGRGLPGGPSQRPRREAALTERLAMIGLVNVALKFRTRYFANKSGV